MGETKIEWCDYTFNPWTGCQKISPGCANCYAETIANRFSLGSWGPNGERKIASDTYWQQPSVWNRKAERQGVRLKVFCASMADVFEERPELVEPRLRLFSIIGKTTCLDWQLLTKRPQFAMDHWALFAGYWAGVQPADYWSDLKSGRPVNPPTMPNVWLGVSVEDRQRKYRIGVLRETPAMLRFLSLEPLLEDLGTLDLRGISWVIAGGESGPKARPCSLEWIRSIVRQCEAAGVACFVKQLGSHPIGSWNEIMAMHGAPPGDREDSLVRWKLSDPKGGDVHEFPEDLKVREFPCGNR